MEENIIKTSFTYVDEFGQETTLSKTYTNAIFIDRTAFEFLVEEFKNFLIGGGFSKDTVDTIQIIKD